MFNTSNVNVIHTLHLQWHGAARHHTHRSASLAKYHPPNPDDNILPLLVRDILRVRKVCEQISDPVDAPFTQRLDLGWVVIGDVCLGGAHRLLHGCRAVQKSN